MRLVGTLLIILLYQYSWGQISLTTIGTAYTQNFNSLANSGTSSALPAGWAFSESGSGANTVYSAGTGSSLSGDTYSFGSTSATDRALGGLQSGSLIPTFGASFTNNTGTNITSLDIAYFGEQWRLGAIGRVDQLDFQYSLNATSLTTGTWTDVNSLDFIAPNSTGTVGALNGNLGANQTSISSAISSLSISNGVTFWIRWTDFNATGSDDGLGVDDFSITPQSSIANSITTTNVTGAPFAVNCNLAASGTVDFTSAGTYTAVNIYTAQLSNSVGSFASPTSIGTISSTANSGTINVTIPAGTANGSAYRIRVISSSPSVIGTDNGANLTVNLTACSIAASNLTGAPFSVDCGNSGSDSGTIDFTTSGTLNAGNIYTVQLSDALGNFGSSTSIGLLTSSANSGTINFTIPPGMSTGTGYRIRVVSNSPVITGSDNGSNITINQTNACPPQLPAQGLIINEWSNGPASEQEYYEFVVTGQCGDLVDIRGYILDDNNATFTNPADYDANASGIAPGHFRFSNSMQWANIPVGSLIVIYNNNDRNPLVPADDPTDANNDSLYVIPHTSTLFERCGTFPAVTSPDSTYSPCTYSTSLLTGWAALSLRNAGDAIQVRNPDGSYYFGVSYGGNEITGGPHNLKLFSGSGSGRCGWFSSGNLFDITNWSSGLVAGNETPGIPNNAANLAWLREMRNPTTLNCPIVVLPTTTVFISIENKNDVNYIHWQTESEQNNDYFTVSHSTNGIHFDELGKIQGAGNSNWIMNYHFKHDRPNKGINYYKLNSTDYDGKTYEKGVVSIMVESNSSYYDPITSSFKFYEKSDYSIFTADGKLIGQIRTSDTFFHQEQGVYLILNERNGLTERIIIP